MGSATSFRPILDSPSNSPDAETLVLCSGKHYYTLSETLSSTSTGSNVALVRIEELSPFPYKVVRDVLEKYSGARVVWAQEEPENQGAWSYVRPRLEGLLQQDESNSHKEVTYVGRKSSATVAVAVGDWHKREAAEIIKGVMDLA